MKILHIAAECYPAAKSGGLGDVVGALPKYQCAAGASAGVLIPKYNLRWMRQHRFEAVHHGAVRLHQQYVPYVIEQAMVAELGFPLYMVHVPGLFDRDGIYADNTTGYGYDDDLERYLVFQQAALQWVASWAQKPQVLHCHDHHTGLIPFMAKHCPEFRVLRTVPTVFTIHNGAYHGAFSWRNEYLLPYYDANARGLLDWADTINPLATGIKCCWRLTTVSPGYLRELADEAGAGLHHLIRAEWGKAAGILNGIDAQVWNPATDPMIAHHFDGNDIDSYKGRNKEVLCRRFRIRPDLPLVTFIGRLVGEKGADLLPDIISKFLYSGHKATFVVLGSGQPHLAQTLLRMREHFVGYVDVSIEYNEALAHQLYAGSDFLLMPSRVEPCGLNQMYAMRYGTLPIVRAIGGLRDTVPDVGDEGGRGFRFMHLNADDACHALHRATLLYRDWSLLRQYRRRVMQLDFAWERSTDAYFQLYRSAGAVL